MEVKLIGFTNATGETQNFSLQNSLEFCSKMGGICYMKGKFEDLLNESQEASKKRLKILLKSGHHSVFDHVKLNFEMSNIPKIIAMILNNEKDYTTSEKSARYTKFEDLPGKEGELYSKWMEKLTKVIFEKYPNLYDKNSKNPMLKITKLAQENARYFVSIFTPSTAMAYTVSLRQLNYIIYMMEDYINTCDILDEFNILLVPYLKQFISFFDEYQVDVLTPNGKSRKLSLFGNLKYFGIKDCFSYTYQTTFEASYACMAQSQRHRSEHTFMYNLKEFKFYVPEILEDNQNLKEEWLSDAVLVKDIYPQGRIIKIVQTGNIDTLLLKARERVCGQAQLEIMRHTVQTLRDFESKSEYGDILKEQVNNATAKCKFKNGTCSKPCAFGAKQFERKI